MRQSIQLLGMSVKDLSEYVDSLLAKNPFLQKLIDEKGYNKHNRSSGLRTAGDDHDRIDSAKQDENPRFKLLSQLKMAGLDSKALEIAEYLIFEMDDNGYITIDPEVAAKDLSVEPEEVDVCLEVIQNMEPAGIGAKDVRECLQLQLKRRGKEDSLEYRVVSDFLSEVARNDVEKIAGATRSDEEKVKDAINYIRKLNPRPASTILSVRSETVIPELVAKVDADSVRLELNKDSVPRLKIYNPYENDLDIVKDPETRKFLKENIDIAKGLIDGLKRREDTICKIAKYILEFQKDAVNKEEAPKTLTLNDVAKALNFHPSTVSRAISNKHIQLNDAVVPIKSLLSHGLRKDNGDITSKTAIKRRIAEMVKGEASASPLKDGEIETRLKKEGVGINRRTVAKYRKALRILPAYLRRRV